MNSKLILIMIDGVSSDYFIDYPQFMPHTHALAKNNTVITNLSPEKCGSSLPGRTSILTGESSKKHGIYGNSIWDNNTKSFRYATPYDVQIPTLFTHATTSGLDTANIGYGMIKPEDCTLYQSPHWVNEFVSRARDDSPVPVSKDWQKALQCTDNSRLTQAKENITKGLADKDSSLVSPLFNELMQDQHMIQLVCELINSSKTPDLIFTEINCTDSAQHQFGYASETSNFVIAFADMLVGTIMQALQTSSKASEYTVVVTSDHGHGNTEKAVYINNVLPNQNWNSECSILFIENNSEIDDSVKRLKPFATEPLDDGFLPDHVRDQIFPLATKDKISFEHASADSSAYSGESKYKSSHSYYPDTQSDKRFAVVNGTNFRDKQYQNGTAEQLYVIMQTALHLG